MEKEKKGGDVLYLGGGGDTGLWFTCRATCKADNPLVVGNSKPEPACLRSHAPCAPRLISPMYIDQHPPHVMGKLRWGKHLVVGGGALSHQIHPILPSENSTKHGSRGWWDASLGMLRSARRRAPQRSANWDGPMPAVGRTAGAAGLAGRAGVGGSIPTPRRLGWAAHDLTFPAGEGRRKHRGVRKSIGLLPVLCLGAPLPWYSQRPFRVARGLELSLLRHRNGRVTAGRTASRVHDRLQMRGETYVGDQRITRWVSQEAYCKHQPKQACKLCRERISHESKQCL